jgi:hypothetical protein
MITVMGATGNTGRKITELLLEAGEEVRALVRSPEKLAELDALGAETVVGDVRDADYLASTFAGADAVYTLTASHTCSCPTKSWWRSSLRPPGSRPTSPPCSSSSTKRSAKAGCTRSRVATRATRHRPSSRSSPPSSHTPTRRRRDVYRPPAAAGPPPQPAEAHPTRKAPPMSGLSVDANWRASSGPAASSQVAIAEQEAWVGGLCHSDCRNAGARHVPFHRGTYSVMNSTEPRSTQNCPELSGGDPRLRGLSRRLD